MELLQKLKSVLERLNLGEREIAFYTTVLKMPGQTVHEIGKKCGFPKDRAYQLFESLKFKELVVAKTKCGRREIFPCSLKNFSQDIYAKSCKLWKYAETLKKLDPALPFLNESKSTRNIEAFSVQDFPEHWEDMSYWDWEEVFAYGNFEMLLQGNKDTLPADYAFRDNRAKRGKFANPLLLPGDYTNELIKNDSREFRETRVLDIPEFKDDLIIVFPSINRVSIWSKDTGGTINGLFIHDSDLTRFHTRMHRYFRQVCEKVDERSFT